MRGISSPAPRRRSISLAQRSEEHTSELSHDQISYAVFCLKKKKHTSELQSRSDLVCRLLLETKSGRPTNPTYPSPPLPHSSERSDLLSDNHAQTPEMSHHTQPFSSVSH